MRLVGSLRLKPGSDTVLNIRSSLSNFQFKKGNDKRSFPFLLRLWTRCLLFIQSKRFFPFLIYAWLCEGLMNVERSYHVYVLYELTPPLSSIFVWSPSNTLFSSEKVWDKSQIPLKRSTFLSLSRRRIWLKPYMKELAYQTCLNFQSKYTLSLLW